MNPIDKAIQEGDKDTIALLWRQEWAMALLQKERQYPDHRSETDPYDLLRAVIAPGRELQATSMEAAEELVNGRPFVRATTRGSGAKQTMPWKRKRLCWRPECGTKFMPQRKANVYCSPKCQKLHKKFTFKGREKCMNGHTRTKQNTGWRKKKGGTWLECLDCRKAASQRYELQPHRKARRQERERAKTAAKK